MASANFLYAICICFSFLVLSSATTVTHDGRAIKINGTRRILISGSIHYPRSTPEMWPDLIKKAKEGGLDAIETYVFWNAHEPERRKYDFTGNLDLFRFIKAIQAEGLFAILRIGPYVCAEWNYGGFPVWLHNRPGIQFRTANEVFMDEMQGFTEEIVLLAKQQQLFASQGGPIILAQIENEYGNIMSAYGAGGKAYINWCANMANSLDIGVPWIMCQQDDAPQPMINTCNGWYCDQFTPNNPNSPKMWTENWTGWFKGWGGKDPHRTAEDLAFAVARFFQTGGTLQNYYMYHGGTNFGRTAGGPYITTSYDYDAPLNEYGNLNQPKYGHLKQLHAVLHSMEYTLTHGDISTINYDNAVTATIYASEKGSSCFLSNANSTTDATIVFQYLEYKIPAWSVSILPDCKNVAYNTAKVTTQTTTMVNQKTTSFFDWSWRPEDVNSTIVLGSGDFSADQLLDQKIFNDSSDYLWHMTSVDLKKDDPIWTDDMSLRINGTGHVLHAFVNGEIVGSQWRKNDLFEKSIKLKQGRNLITILSSTVGLQNYGARFDLGPTGIPGPVELVGRKNDETIIKDLSSGNWTYRVGLQGLNQTVVDNNIMYNLNLPETFKWQDKDLPFFTMMTWYKGTFKTPSGNDPVVLDMLGMEKGLAWVNGYSIGRYWPSILADDDDCTEKCDYRGAYNNNKCLTNCGKPSQRVYHIPRSFLKNDPNATNTLVLFEEFGGSPFFITLQTVTVGKVSGRGNEGDTIELSCYGKPISAIQFASFGDPQRTSNGSFEKGSCEGSKDALSIAQKACVGKETCAIKVSADVFGCTNCEEGVENSLAVEALC
ncbi:hypothetical protein JCGZ_07515 [Jatropha curcas]|uniref:Beta-galactosidase n=1 Tax=Jatropha curcas TaxID=180498 RepID=A0A067KQ38_JATCU|nr:beta-galactosidase 15 [Jatropha curcas]KDP33944.1 hypothetical protein JCGZ_07515 [Jatropha curcas]